MKLTFIDWTIMVIYFVFVLGIGFALKRYMKTSTKLPATFDRLFV